ncbi:hypothetical protein VNI00_015620 [Paramarasmius palmivorus]|uniref:Mid2 domain-containing protein n=1 Tax=Paramarasmius palmivorus TaxID=297713 RepID=A0AAW0BIB0_9AGAR
MAQSFPNIRLVTPASAQDEHGFTIDSVDQILSSDQTQLNISWHFNIDVDPEFHINFTLVFALGGSPKSSALQLCNGIACIANFSSESLRPGGYRLQARKDDKMLDDYKKPLSIQVPFFDPSALASDDTSASDASSTNQSSINTTSSDSSSQSEFASLSTASTSQTPAISSPNTNTSDQPEDRVNRNLTKSTIIGASVGGGIAFTLIILALLYFCRRRRHSKRRNSALSFDRSLMVKSPGHHEVEVEMDARPYSEYPYPGSSTASVVASDSGLTEKPNERQKEIDERMRQLQDLLSTLETQPQTGAEESIGKVTDRIK